MDVKKPRARERGEAKEGKGVFKRGEGTGQGPVGSGQGPRVDQSQMENAKRELQEEFRKKAEDLRRKASDDAEPVSRGMGGGQASKGLDLGDILGALGGLSGAQNVGQNYSGQPGSAYSNLTPQQQQQLQQQLIQELQQQQAQMQAQQQAQQQAQMQAQQQAYQKPPQSSGVKPGYTSGGTQSGGAQAGGKKGSRMGCLILIIAIILLFLIFKMMKPASNTNTTNNNSNSSSGTETTTTQQGGTSTSSGNSGSSGSGSSTSGGSYGFGGLSSNSGSNTSLFGGTSATGASVAAGSGYSSGWQLASNNGSLNTSIATGSGIREKYTKIKGNGEDDITIMIYMCGTDLESNYAMATRDLQEMLASTRSDKIKIVLFTGGCTRWQNDVMSNGINQIYDITPSGLRRINDNAGNSSMTSPDTLEAFVKWANENYPSNRMALIFWDHGGGSVSGYGYDQRYQRAGAMSLTQINQALNNAGVKFDFIGFDACLMATAETAIMAANHADYMIASEEVEPGIGWYYTEWLNELSKNTSMSTVDLGKKIIDDYTLRCQRETPGQDTTLSIVDLAELQHSLPEKLAKFGEETSSLIENGNYQLVAKARSSSQEFSRESKIDQIDLAHFAHLLGTPSGKDLIQSIMSSVKYNRTSRGMPNAYGLSLFFPYRRPAYIDVMTNAYKVLGIDDKMAKALKQFGQVQVSGQASSGGSQSPLWSLLNSDGNGSWTSGSNYGSGYGSGGSSGSYGGTISSNDLNELLGLLLGGSASSSAYESYGIPGFGGRSANFMTEDTLDQEVLAKYISENILNADDFLWKENAEGYASIQLTDEQWANITSVEMSMYYDDGEGYIDLGLDNIYDVDNQGNLLPVVDNSWISIDGQPIAYYHLYTYDSADSDEYTIVGRSPIMLNDQRADLILVFDNEKPEGYIAGVRYTYPEGETETVAKAQESLTEGDKIDFLCDYYGYDGAFQDSYFLGEQYTVGADPSAIEISNTIVGDDILVTYKFMDIFGETYWTPALK